MPTTTFTVSTENNLDSAIQAIDAGGADAAPGGHLRFLAAYAAHARAGDAQAALRAASDACHAAPHLPQPHYAYGEAWLALDQPARAEQAFAAAIRLVPAWPEAWINYGLARYRQGAIEDTKTAMREALRRAPDHPVATANLGAFLWITGEPEAGEALLRRSIANAPDNAGARLNLAADLLAVTDETGLSLATRHAVSSRSVIRR